MVDLMRSLLLVLAVVASVRSRDALGVVLAVACGTVLAFELALVLRYPVKPLPLELAIGSVFIGPTALPHVPPFPITAVLSDPLHHLGAAGVGAIGARHAFAKSEPLRPETEAARRFDREGLCFVALGVIHALLSVSGFLAHMLSS